jgi:hypothetical protein
VLAKELVEGTELLSLCAAGRHLQSFVFV